MQRAPRLRGVRHIEGHFQTSAPAIPERLDSWKEIARHLRRTVRTVQRWEALGLPVYRHGHVAGSSVYAYRAELDRWWTAPGPVEATEGAPGHLAGGPGVPRVAVLPFTNLGPGSDAAHFSEGFVDELITALASSPGIVVVSRTSVMQFRDRPSIPVKQVASLLSVSLLVEGALQRHGDEVLVTVRLVDPFDAGRVIWGQRYGCLHPEVRQLQAQVAADIARHAAGRGGSDGPSQPQAARRVNPEAQEAYLMGRFYLHKRAATSLLAALERFGQAVAFDPSDARGYAGLAETYVLLSGNEFWTPEAGFPKAREAAQQALDRDPNNAVAHASLGMVRALYEWRWDEAEREFGRAIELSPNYADAWHWCGMVRLMAGRVEASIAPLDRAVELDPLSPVIAVNAGRPLHFLQQYDGAIGRCNHALSFAPGFWLAHINRAFAYSAQGDAQRAIDAARSAVEWSKGNGAAILALAEAHAVAGDAPSALAVIDRVAARLGESGTAYASAFRVARVFARLGERERAFAWLARSMQERSLGNATYMPLDPALDSLRGDSRFAGVLQALNLTKEVRT